MSIGFAGKSLRILPVIPTDSQGLWSSDINDSEMQFEPLHNFSGGRSNPVPQLYQSAAVNMGFLTLQGSEVLVPLDGQHRTKAFKYAIDGVDDNGREIAGVQSNFELSKDQVAVILVRFAPGLARMIFNKLNRYAKATTRANNLVTDDDDSIAVITRELIGSGGVMNARLVRTGTNALPANAPEFTTLPTLYDCNLALVNGLGFSAYGKPQNMPADQRSLVKGELRAVWERLLSRIDLWAKAITDPSAGGDRTRIEIRESALLGRPIGQFALIMAYLMMRERCVGVPEEELCSRFNRISWDPSGVSMWRNVLVTPDGRMLAGRLYANRASRFIAHLGGAKLTEDEERELREQIHGDEWKDHELPPPVA